MSTMRDRLLAFLEMEMPEGVEPYPGAVAAFSDLLGQYLTQDSATAARIAALVALCEEVLEGYGLPSLDHQHERDLAEYRVRLAHLKGAG